MSDDERRSLRVEFVLAMRYVDVTLEAGRALPPGWENEYSESHRVELRGYAERRQRELAALRQPPAGAAPSEGERTPPPSYPPELAEILRAFQSAHVPEDGQDEFALPPDDPLQDYADWHYLGAGGQGVVFTATDRRTLNREVVVKFPRSPATADAVRTEARLQDQVRHPNVQPIYRFGETSFGLPFLVRAKFDGRTLEDCLTRRSPTPEERDRLIRQFERLAEGVAAGHRCGIVHCDVKPPNAVVGDGDAVLVIDWGLAFQPGAGSRPHPRPGAGTAEYMSREQAEGLAIDQRADVWALGVILLHVLSGKPSKSDDPSNATRGWRDAIAGLDRLGAVSDCDRLVSLTRDCLSEKPDLRPLDAAVVAARVAGYFEGLRADKHRSDVELARAEQRARWRVRLAAVSGLAVLLICWLVAADAHHRLDLATRDANELARREKQRTALENAIDRLGEALKAEDLSSADAARVQIEGFPGEIDDQSRARLEPYLADLTLLRELNRIDDFRWMPGDRGVPDRGQVAAALADAFRRYGIAPGTTPPAEAAQRVNDSPLRERLLGAIDLWLVCDRSPGVRGVLTAADRDDYREALRDALLAGVGVTEWTGEKAALAQPPRFVTALALAADVPLPHLRVALMAARESNRQDLSVLMAIAGLYPPAPHRPSAAGRAGWLQQAVAARPDSLAARYNLGLALLDLGEADKAETEFRAAVKLRPESALAYAGLGRALAERGLLDAAIEEFRKAVDLDPKAASARVNLGDALTERGDKEAGREYAAAVALLRGGVAELPPTARGNVLLAEGDRDGATLAYREAARNKTAWAHPYRNLASLHADRGQWFASSQAIEDGLGTYPRLEPALRYDRARYAVLAASGQAKDEPRVVNRLQLRNNALQWLTFELAAQKKLADTPGGAKQFLATLDNWLATPDLKAVREVQGLPAGERERWEGFWADVRKFQNARAPGK